MAVVRRRVVISGMVQGVFFRAYTRDAARRAGVTGWVRNLPDGRVEAVFEGEPEVVARVVQWCRHGSPGSRVAHVEVTEEVPKGDYQGFEIAFSGRAF